MSRSRRLLPIPKRSIFLVEAFDAKRVVLPRTLTIGDIARIGRKVKCEIEVFVFGGLCVMAEGRCSLSSYATGKSPNMNGVCSSRRAMCGTDRTAPTWCRSSALILSINRFSHGEAAGYPTLCKGRFDIGDARGYAFEDPVSLDVMGEIEALKDAGVSALKIEGRQRGKAYVAEVVSTLRQVLATAPRGVAPCWPG